MLSCICSAKQVTLYLLALFSCNLFVANKEHAKAWLLVFIFRFCLKKSVFYQNSMDEQSGELIEHYKALTDQLEEKNRVSIFSIYRYFIK